MERCGDYGGRRRKVGVPCGKPAGWGIPNKTTGKCRIHGGANEGRPVEHGRYSVKHRAKLAEQMQHFIEDPTPGDLTHELAMMRALLQSYLDNYPDHTTMGHKETGYAFDYLNAISSLVERISRIQNQTALTQADILYVQAVIADLILRFIDDPEKRASFLGELRKALGIPDTAHRAEITAIEVE